MKISGLLFLAVLFLACERIVDMDSLRPEPKLVLNGVLKTGEPVRVTLSRTWFYSDGKPNVTIPGANVKLYVNDVFRDRLSFVAPEKETESGCYESAFTPSAGDRVRITASVAGYPDVASVTELPKLMPVDTCRLVSHISGFWEKDSLNVYHLDYTLELVIRDDPDEANYYLIYGKEQFRHSGGGYGGEVWEDTGVYMRSCRIRFADDPLFKTETTAFDFIFGTGNSQNEYWGAFSDELIEGKSYTMRLPIGNGSYTVNQSKEDGTIMEPGRFCFYLQSISKDYYDYLKTLQKLNSGFFIGDLASSGFAEPIRIPSNVEGGTGIVGGVTESLSEWREEDFVTFPK